MGLRVREVKELEVSPARQSAERYLTDLERTQRERLTGVDRLRLARHGPTSHVTSHVALPPDTPEDSPQTLAENQDADLKRRLKPVYTPRAFHGVDDVLGW